MKEEMDNLKKKLISDAVSFLLINTNVCQNYGINY